eukprot:CAMPEP_0117443538 /NCGR_PEP_ID=MMETSP0759-20121206/4745_1 /TAXON_ID=63605 /ORGANISM="Percolomonas cosmopolitus, Strain WS" /LENGTH=125 /DNA_ID=CAMNT_0005235513 /DNA_START=63 /DNA_END=440 /DNA_ORIENTATION=+
MSFEQIGKAFIGHYYQQFDQNISSVAGLYADNALMTWQEKQIQGKVNILKHMSGEGPRAITFKAIQHNPDTIDVQPSISGGILVFVNGFVKVDGEQEFRYSEVFHLASKENSCIITNNIFRLITG